MSGTDWLRVGDVERPANGTAGRTYLHGNVPPRNTRTPIPIHEDDMTTRTSHLTLVVQTGHALCEHERTRTAYRHESTTVGEFHYFDEVCLDCGMHGPFARVVPAELRSAHPQPLVP